MDTEQPPPSSHKDRYFELLTRTEDLNDELADWVTESSFGPTLKHPLLFELFYTPAMNAVINERFRFKKEYVAKAEAEGDWSQYIWLHERPHRMEKFAGIRHRLSDKEYWGLLGSIWVDSENLWQYGHLLHHLLDDPRRASDRTGLMSEEEQALLASLPKEVAVYRGHQAVNRLGYSWSLCNWKAGWFSGRFRQKRAGVVRGVVNREDITGLLLGRGEFEVVVPPHLVRDVSPVRRPRRPGWVNACLERGTAAFALGADRSVHGIRHWEKVERNALALASQTPGADRTVARLFALLHDSQRVNENSDPDHGVRAGVFCRRLYESGELKVTKAQLEVLVYACSSHNVGETTKNPTVGVCWDADRLDLTRVGIVPDPKYFSTAAAGELLWKI